MQAMYRLSILQETRNNSVESWPGERARRFCVEIAGYQISSLPSSDSKASMHTGQITASLLFAFFLSMALGGRSVEAQDVRIEAGGGWGIPSSNVDMPVEGQDLPVRVNPGSGAHVYGAVGLVWMLSDTFTLEGRLRGQHSRMPGSYSVFVCEACTFSNDPDGRLRAATVEGQITITSTGRIQPYFLVGLGIVRTTVDGVLVTRPDGTEVQFLEVDVVDAGGDVGFGAKTPIVGGLLLTAEIRATGSLPGAKENAITVFPFSLGLSYSF